jgi:hypothetical protein
MGSKKSIRRNNSGQMLVVTSLVIILLLISTIVYVTDIEKNAPVFVSNGNSGLSALKQAAAHTLVSVLANITNGGDRSNLANDLNRFKSAVESHSYNAISKINFAGLNSTPYSEGIWIFHGSEGEGISSVFVNFALNSTGNSASYYSEYAINITSSIRISGNYTLIDENQSQVKVSCKVFNEGRPASASNLTVFYKQEGTMVLAPTSLASTIDYGNGTYLSFFHLPDIIQNGKLPISVNCVDTRGVSVWANTTCLQT